MKTIGLVFFLITSFACIQSTVLFPAFADNTTEGFITVQTGFLVGYAKADFYGEPHETTLAGMKFEIYKGYFAKSHPNLEYGLSFSYSKFYNEFNLEPDINPYPDQVTRMPFELIVRLEGTALLARVGYSLQKWDFKINAVLGIGVVRVFQEIQWELNPHSTQAIGDIERDDVTKPVFDISLGIQYQFCNYFLCGLYGRIMPFPLRAELVNEESTVEYSLWKTETIYELGLAITILL